MRVRPILIEGPVLTQNLRGRARALGFEPHADFDTQTMTLTRGENRWEFQSLREAHWFMAGLELAQLSTAAPANPAAPVDNPETAADPVDNSGSGPQRQIGTFSCDVNQLKDLAARNGVIHKQRGGA